MIRICLAVGVVMCSLGSGACIDRRSRRLFNRLRKGDYMIKKMRNNVTKMVDSDCDLCSNRGSW